MDKQQTDAAQRATDYLTYFTMSRQGIIDQMIFDGYDEQESAAAVDKLDVNWDEVAVRKAALYRTAFPMTEKRLTYQLRYDGFTEEQTARAVQAVR